MAHTHVLCEIRKNIPPACEGVSSKLDILTTTISAHCLLGEQLSSIKQNLLFEINHLKQLIKADQDYLGTVKDDLIVIKDEITRIETWEDNLRRVDSTLPAIPTIKVSRSVQNGLPQASLQQAPLAPLGPGAKKTDIPTFRSIEDREWSNVPNYLKLRLKLEEVNDFVQVLNKELVVKYSLLRRKKATLKKTELSLWTSYIALETSETKGLYFVVTSDLKKHGISEKTVSSMSSILRHCRCLREVRTGKTIRLVVIT